MIEIRITGESRYDLKKQFDALIGEDDLKALHSEMIKELAKTVPAEADARDLSGADAPIAAEIPATEPEAAPVPPPANKITLEEVRAKGLTAARSRGQAVVKALLEEFGASNISSLSPDQYAAFAERLDGLGDEVA